MVLPAKHFLGAEEQGAVCVGGEVIGGHALMSGSPLLCLQAMSQGKQSEGWPSPAECG